MNENMPLTMTWVLAFAGIMLAIQWFDFLGQWMGSKIVKALRGLDLASREAVTALAEAKSRGSILEERVKGLLSAWSQGWSAREVLQLAALQRERYLTRARSMATFILTLMTGSILALLAMRRGAELNMHILVAAAGIAVTGATFFLRVTLLGWIERTLEKELLSRLPGNLPGTGMTAQDLATALGGSIESAFKNYLPQPDKMAAAISGSIEGTRKAIETAGGQMGSELKAVAEKWQAILAAHAQQLEKAAANLTSGIRAGYEPVVKALQESLGEHATRIQQSGTAWNQILKESLGEHAGGMQKAGASWNQVLKESLGEHANRIQQTGAAWNQQMHAALDGHSASLESTTKQLAQHLEHIHAVGRQVEEVLHIQQLVEETIKSVTTTEEFRETMVALRSHIEESDKLLREVTRPRTIRLIESEGESRSG
jgi:hypothetical protein